MDIWTAIWLLLCCLAWPTTLDAFYRKPKGFYSKILPDNTWAPTDRLLESMGYAVEIHTVHTPDGYILTLHRVPRAMNGSLDRPTHRTPVLCAAGLGGNSEMWLLRKEGNVALTLVDAGFDVWLTNFRGSFYGKKHETLYPKLHEFWDFSWHENGLLDQPAIIDYVLQTTGRTKLITIGHSMGTTAQTVLMSERPDYAREKVLCSIFLAPPVFFANPATMGVLWRGIYYLVPGLKESTGRHVVNDKMPMLDQSMITYCFTKQNTQFNYLCRLGLSLLLGKPAKPIKNGDQILVDPTKIKLIRLLVFGQKDIIIFNSKKDFVITTGLSVGSTVHAMAMLSHFPAGASIRQVLHFGQSLASGGFEKYDFGPDKNKQLYGSASPPAYNLSAITTPIYVFYGTSDGLVSRDDAERFVDNCPAVKEVYKLPYNHMDYFLADTVSEDVSKPILDILAKYI